MKKNFRKLSLAFAMISTFAFFASSCHSHSFTRKLEDAAYLKSEANCQSGTTYYYSCECGEKGEETFSVGKATKHDFSGLVEEDKYIKKEETCQSGAVYFKSCVTCGMKSSLTFTSEELGEHSYTEEIPDGKYLKEEATPLNKAVYYKSCVCGEVGTDTFAYGEPLRAYTTEEKAYYKPASLTVTLYDTEASLYGFTYNTSKRPLRPVIQVAKDSEFTGYTEYPASVEEETSYETSGNKITYYIVKAEIALEKSTTYTYRAYDRYVDVGTDVTTLKTKDLSATSFSFAHVSDTQGYPQAFGNVLKSAVDENDFILHTGDVVENSTYESEWKAMLDGNFNYLSQIPVMAISGNHETTYQNSDNETYKHFHNKMVEQDTNLGYYYSFTYGNVKFVMLNTNRLSESSLTSDQYNWLENELKSNTADWTIVAMHNPMYSAGTYGSDPGRNYISLALRRQLKGLFAEYGVDVVLQGHDHLISRTKPLDADGKTVSESTQVIGGVSYSVNPQGVYYVMSGTGGEQTRSPYDGYDTSLYSYAEASVTSSWTEFSIDGDKLTATVKCYRNNAVETIRQWGVLKTA